MTPSRNLTIDSLHAINLGVMNKWARTTMWFLMLCGIYGDLGNQEANIAVAIMVLRNSLVAWYKTFHRTHPNETLTEITDLTRKMTGTRADKKLKTKGAETWGIVLFLLDELEKFGARLGPEASRLHRAGQALVDMMVIWRTTIGEFPNTSGCARSIPTSCIWHLWPLTTSTKAIMFPSTISCSICCRRLDILGTQANMHVGWMRV